MKNGFIALAACLGLGMLVVSLPAPAHDVDGGPDCGRSYREFGDAPEGVLAYPGVIGAFPTCSGFGLPSTQEFVCPPISSPPGPSGFVMHVAFGNGGNYWLGCYTDPSGAPMGVDNEFDGKMNQPAIGISLCDHAPTDCVEAAFGLTFDQDECYTDGSDAGVKKPTLLVCSPSSVTYNVFNCGGPRVIFLNILIDMNQDGDWNDNFACNPVAAGCAYEWAVKNIPVTLLPGCNILVSPTFLVGPKPGPGWMRVTICDDPVDPSFPWLGSLPGTFLRNGETEDYPVDIEIQTPALPGSWGKVKAIYRR